MSRNTAALMRGSQPFLPGGYRRPTDSLIVNIMQPLQSANDPASAVMDVALHVSRLVRAEAWQHRPAGLSIPQFRTLQFLNAYPQSAPSVVADYLMLSRPAASRLIEELVQQKLVRRRSAESDRRRLCLSLTSSGSKQLQSQYAIAREAIAERMAALPAPALAQIARAMDLLLPIFAAARATL